LSGIGADGDVHAFEMDNLRRAEEMVKVIGEGLQDVELLTSEAPPAGAAQAKP
jgi:hypothetical protein